MNGFNTIAITLDDDVIELFARLTAHTGLTAADVIRKLIPAHVADLWELDRYLKQLPKSDPRWARARYLLDNYGPDSLIDDIKRLDPDYKTPAQRFSEGSL